MSVAVVWLVASLLYGPLVARQKRDPPHIVVFQMTTTVLYFLDTVSLVFCVRERPPYLG